MTCFFLANLNEGDSKYGLHVLAMYYNKDVREICDNLTAGMPQQSFKKLFSSNINPTFWYNWSI